MWRQNIQRPSSFRPSRPSQESTSCSTTVTALTSYRFDPRPVAKRREVFEGCTFYVSRKRDEPGETFFTCINKILALGGKSTKNHEDTTITHYLVVLPDCYVPDVPILEAHVAGCKKWQRIIRDHAKWAHEAGNLDTVRNTEERRRKVVVKRDWIQDVLTGVIDIREEGQWGVYLQSDRQESPRQTDERGGASDPVRRAVDPRIRPSTTSSSTPFLHHSNPPSPTYSITHSPTYIASPLLPSPESLNPQPASIESPNPFEVSELLSPIYGPALLSSPVLPLKADLDGEYHDNDRAGQSGEGLSIGLYAMYQTPPARKTDFKPVEGLMSPLGKTSNQEGDRIPVNQSPQVDFVDENYCPSPLSSSSQGSAEKSVANYASGDGYLTAPTSVSPSVSVTGSDLVSARPTFLASTLPREKSSKDHVQPNSSSPDCPPVRSPPRSDVDLSFGSTRLQRLVTPDNSVNESSPPRRASRKRSRHNAEDEEYVEHEAYLARPTPTKRQSLPSGWSRADSPLTPAPSGSSSRSVSRSRITSGSSVTSASTSTSALNAASTSTSALSSRITSSSARTLASNIEMQPSTLVEAMSRVPYRALMGEILRSLCPGP